MTCALRAPIVIRGLIQDRRLRADRFIIRAQSAIRADGPPSAQVSSPQREAFFYGHRRRRAGIARSARQPAFPDG